MTHAMRRCPWRAFDRPCLWHCGSVALWLCGSSATADTSLKLLFTRRLGGIRFIQSLFAVFSLMSLHALGGQKQGPRGINEFGAMLMHS